MASNASGIKLAFDVGKVRVGVAKCDPSGILAIPVGTLIRVDEEPMRAELKSLLHEIDPIEIFVGLPFNLKNEETLSTHDAKIFATLLRKETDVPIWMVDERLSTRTAASQLRDVGRNSRTNKGVIDQQAACIILESALNAQRSNRKAGVSFDEI